MLATTQTSIELRGRRRGVFRADADQVERVTAWHTFMEL
jgi:hypothetical protein